MCGLINNSVNNLKKTNEGREKDKQRSKERREKLAMDGRCTDCGELLEKHVIDFSQFDANTLLDEEGKVRPDLLRPRCKKCLQRHASYKLKTYNDLRQEGIMCSRHVSIALEECDGSKGACFQCGIVHMTQQFTSLKCFEQNVKDNMPLFMTMMGLDSQSVNYVALSLKISSKLLEHVCTISTFMTRL
ncbi:hypothetical protein FDP41_005006 [Naegleria fowleri]|uniref:Uncharacterized protein n=1 Tax=Naegleria fowleri TaxID=5763 RepID=A0A6A5BRZ4_NAEFO|nr:uncharacterized protein FDP41_005006 [Naegleria fowleri]KAF0975679.1 hypothetical protein FDP41_005006 [Naegleria fowleri]